MLLKKGSKGDDVKKLQQLLKINPIDGIFGDGTDVAVKNYQKQKGLTIDGIVGDNTWKMLCDNTATTTIAPQNVYLIDKINKLKGVIPQSVFDELVLVLPKSKITNVNRLSHFLAQCSEESMNFKSNIENLNYSLKTLLKMKKYFPTQAIAESYANKPEKIGSKIYANRMGNGNESTKDGFKYRGRGFIQLTGKNNYDAFSKYIGEDCITNPDVVSTKYSLISALYFFDKNNIWTICDKGATHDVVKMVTYVVNGGYNGLDVRCKFFDKYYNTLMG